MDRHTELRSFVLVAEKGSFAAAALVEGVTPVVMGRRLDALEKRLGVKLMHRSTRGLALTELGEQFLEQGRALLAADPPPDQLKAFAERSVEVASLQQDALNDIMMAQDFQDLSGQVINKVIKIISRTEKQLLELLVSTTPPPKVETPAVLEGPQTPDKAMKQDDVDDLLASLGF